MSAATVDRAELQQLAGDVAAAAAELRKLEDERRHPVDARERLRLEAGISTARERLTDAEARFDEARRAWEQAQADERARVDAEKAKARPGLEAQRDELLADRTAAFLALEDALGQLVASIDAACSTDAQLQVLHRQLEEPGERAAAALIQNRIGRRLRDVGVRDLLVIGTQGREPLAEPIGSGDSSHAGDGKPIDGKPLPNRSTKSARKPAAKR